MKERDKSILNLIIDNGSVGLDEMLKLFEISRRTLYYSISNINKSIKDAGEIRRVEGKFAFVGDLEKLKSVLNSVEKDFLDYYSRRNYILKKIILGENLTIEKTASSMAVSKNLVVQTLTDLKNELHHNQLSLVYEGNYLIRGAEIKIREMFMHIISSEDFQGQKIDSQIAEFDKKYDLELTESSLHQLSAIVKLVKHRTSIDQSLECYEFTEDAKNFSYYNDTEDLTCTTLNQYEKAFLTIYICSLTSLKPHTDENTIKKLVKKLITHFEFRAGIKIKKKEQFEQILARHFLFSYNRLRYKIPVHNPLLSEIKNKYKETYSLTQSIISDSKIFPELSGIREEEIAYISTYFGYYVKKQDRNKKPKKQRMLIVGNQGADILKELKSQVEDNFPFVDVIAAVPTKEVDLYARQSDRIISTVPLADHDNVIVVNPVLTDNDLELLMEELSRSAPVTLDIDKVIEIVKQNATVHNEKKLRKEILQTLSQNH
ncbi:transcription antiterminator [Proteinivorax hydrogeniformans]|uniref:Transcription antiterminator n=1 Tax=Proteinivorax hydrogeniformans TaxID=1826727 RepID=A0AAU8HQU5_9FIRM